MKKILLIFSLLAFSVTLANCSDNDKDKVIAVSDLPVVSQTFLTTHFPSETPSRVTKDDDSYDAYFVGYKIEFKKDGQWDNVESIERTQLPQSLLALLPEGIASYISENHPEEFVIEMDKETLIGEVSGYEIKLNTHRKELEFNSEGVFLRYD